MISSPASIVRAVARSRRSSRRFQTDKLIPSATLRDILETTLRSPSSFNLQPTHILLVQDACIKHALSQDAMLGPGNQFRTRDASALAFFLTDLEPTKRVNRIYDLEKDSQSRNVNYLASLPMVPSFLIGEGHAATWLKNVSTDFLANVQAMPVIEPVQAWGYKNTALQAQSFVLAATSHDLATCLMEGYDTRKVQEILRVPDRYAIPLAVAVGYEYEDPETFEETPRLPLSEVVFGDTFGSPWTGDDLSEESEEAGTTSDEMDENENTKKQSAGR